MATARSLNTRWIEGNAVSVDFTEAVFRFSPLRASGVRLLRSRYKAGGHKFLPCTGAHGRNSSPISQSQPRLQIVFMGTSGYYAPVSQPALEDGLDGSGARGPADYASATPALTEPGQVDSCSLDLATQVERPSAAVVQWIGCFSHLLSAVLLCPLLGFATDNSPDVKSTAGA